jgi:hypothetical protein
VSKDQSNLVTIIGEGYLQPIADLMEKWLARPPPPAPNRIQSGFYENGYAAAVVLLLVAMFESYVSRLRYLQDAKGKAIPTNMRNATEVVHHVFPHLRHKKALGDVYVLRDVLIHNHLWEVHYQYGGSHPMVLKRATRSLASGDKKYASRVSSVTHRTKALRLSALPTRVNRTDVRKVFDTIWKTLLEFERANLFAISNQHVRFRGNRIPFHELRYLLNTAGSP